MRHGNFGFCFPADGRCLIFFNGDACGSDWSQDRIMLSTIVNLERLDVINGFGK